MTKEISRRDFVKAGGFGLLGIAFMGGGLNQKLRSIVPEKASKPKPALDEYAASHYWRFAVDTRKCIGCGKCVKACKLENDVPMLPETNRTWVERYVVSDSEEIFVDSPNAGIDGFTADYMNAKYQNLNIQKSFFVPKLCNHCDKPPCVTVCPVGATYATSEGVVLVDRKACIGCRYCVQACPYGARFFDPRLRVVDKCTWCYHRITKGLQPACVEACPVGARVFGDTRDPQSQVSRIIADQTIGVLKPELGTMSKVYYVGLEKGVH
jgi:tetrathionate reductase subunit B